jgi:hypothetical protein
MKSVAESGWNIFDVMSATAPIDPNTQLLTGPFHWLGLIICLFISAILLLSSVAIRHVRMDLTGEVLGQGAPEGLRGRRPVSSSSGLDLFDRTHGLKFFQLQLKLFDLTEDLLALRSEEHALQLLNQQHQTFDLACSRTQRCDVSLVVSQQQRLQRCRIEGVQIGQAEGLMHVRSMAHNHLVHEKKPA